MNLIREYSCRNFSKARLRNRFTNDSQDIFVFVLFLWIWFDVPDNTVIASSHGHSSSRLSQSNPFHSRQDLFQHRSSNGKRAATSESQLGWRSAVRRPLDMVPPPRRCAPRSAGRVRPETPSGLRKGKKGYLPSHDETFWMLYNKGCIYITGRRYIVLLNIIGMLTAHTHTHTHTHTCLIDFQ